MRRELHCLDVSSNTAVILTTCHHDKCLKSLTYITAGTGHETHLFSTIGTAFPDWTRHSYCCAREVTPSLSDTLITPVTYLLTRPCPCF